MITLTPGPLDEECCRVGNGSNLLICRHETRFRAKVTKNHIIDNLVEREISDKKEGEKKFDKKEIRGLGQQLIGTSGNSVRVCVRERQREKERERDREKRNETADVLIKLSGQVPLAFFRNLS